MFDENRPPILPIAIVGGLVILGVLIGAWWMSRKPAPTTPSSKAVASTEAPITTTPPTPLPPLDQMDPMMRSLLGALSNNPELAKWLATEGLMKQLSMAIDQASQGRDPSRNFKVMAPEGPFATAGRGNRRTIDPASYKRYNPLVTAVTSINASELAKVYKTIKPRLNEAYRNNGHPDGDVDQAVQAALDTLLETPVVQDPVALVEGKGVLWLYSDPKLEGLTPSQKQLLRMGPENVNSMLGWLRSLQRALRQ